MEQTKNPEKAEARKHFAFPTKRGNLRPSLVVRVRKFPLFVGSRKVEQSQRSQKRHGEEESLQERFRYPYVSPKKHIFTKFVYFLLRKQRRSGTVLGTYYPGFYGVKIQRLHEEHWN